MGRKYFWELITYLRFVPFVGPFSGNILFQTPNDSPNLVSNTLPHT